MGIFFTLIVVTVSWYTLRNVNVIYVNCTSINTCTIFKIQKNTSWMQLLLRHDGFHVDLSPGTSHVNSFHNCSVLPHIFSPRSSHSSSFKKSVQIMSPRCSEPFSASCPPNSFEQSLCSGRPGPRTPGPTLADECPPHSLLSCCSGLLKPAHDSSRCSVSHREAPAWALPSAWAFLESCGLALKSARDKCYTWSFCFVIICF